MRRRWFAAALFLVGLIPASADVRIRSSPGGEVGTYLTLFELVRKSGERVIIDGQRFDWTPHDTFCVPTWCRQEHSAGSEDAILFTCDDTPVLQALGLYREERE